MTETTPEFKGASSRESLRGAGWACEHRGSFRKLMPRARPRFSWLRPSVLWASRNDIVARLFGDPTDRVRRLWVEGQRQRGAPEDFLLRHSHLQHFSFLVAGDTGEGDSSQYAVVPPLLAAGRGTSFFIIASDVIYPAGDTKDYTENFCRPYRRFVEAIFAVPGNHDWYDGLEGFMRQFCGATTAPPVPQAISNWLGKLLWRRARPANPADLASQERLRPANEGSNRQPGPYFA